MGHRAHNRGHAEADADAAADPDFVAAFARGLRVLRAFGENAQLLTLSEVAERAELTPAGARRLLLTLVKLGYAGTRGRLFYLTPKVLALGHAYLTSLPLYHFAQPIVEQLVQASGETCALSVLEGTDVLYLLRIPVRRILSNDLGIGTRRPAFATSMGRVLLGGLPPHELDAFLERADLRPFTAKTLTDRDKLAEAIAADRRQGFSWVSGELDETVSGLSVPITDEAGATIAALNMSFNRTKIARAEVVRRHLPQLREAAQQLQRSMLVRAGARADRPAGQVGVGR